MKIRNFLYVLLFVVFAISCTTDGDPLTGDNNPGGGGGTEEPSKPTEPTTAHIKFGRNYIVADYNGGSKSVVVDVTPDLEWEITTSGEEWFSAKQVENSLVVTFSECSDKLERQGSITVKVSTEANVAEASVKVLQIGIDTEELIYDIETTVAEQTIYAAPNFTNSEGLVITIDWGDGNEPERVTTKGIRYLSHVYTTPGIYTIIAFCESVHNLEFSRDDTLCPELKNIYSWGKMGYKNAANMCKGCINLESIPADVAGSFENVSSFVAAFLGCEKLKEIPEGLFQHAKKAKKFANCFRYAASISEIPENLFANNTLAEEFYFTFYGTGTDYKITDEALKINTGNYLNSYPAEHEQSNAISNGILHSVPEKLFSKCPNVTRFEYLFGETAITTVPEKIFAANSAATNFDGVFFACTNFTTIPANFMKSATAATNIRYMFAGCVSLTEIPVAMFENCTNVTNLEYIFSLTGVKSLKKDIFKGLSQVKTVGAVFRSCTSLTDIEAGVFDGLTAAESFQYCFADCTSLRTIPAGLLAGMSTAYEFKSMFANTALESVPAGLFDEVRDYDLADYAYIFADCPNLKTVPATLFDHVTELASNGMDCLFVGSGIETIPAGLFATCTKADSTSFEGAFYGCPELKTVEGSIFPEVTSITKMTQLFAFCPKLENLPADLFKPLGTAKLRFTQTFEDCTSLKTLPEGLFAHNTETTHFTGTFTGCTALESLPENLLASCANLAYVNRMFSGCTALKAVPERLFANNPKIETFEETFLGCAALETLPEKLFSALEGGTKSVIFANSFNGCSALKRLPAGLFDTVCRISSINGCFEGCKSLTGESPYTMVGEEKVHLYERVQSTTENPTPFLRVPSLKSSHEACFKGCSGLTDYATMPDEWKE